MVRKCVLIFGWVGGPIMADVARDVPPTLHVRPQGMYLQKKKLGGV